MQTLMPIAMRQLLAIASRGAPALDLAAVVALCGESQPQQDCQEAQQQQHLEGQQQQRQQQSQLHLEGQDQQHQSQLVDRHDHTRGQKQPQPSSVLDAPVANAHEPFPRVHAFNCLRCVFTDSQLSVDTSGYFAEGVEVRRTF